MGKATAATVQPVRSAQWGGGDDLGAMPPAFANTRPDTPPQVALRYLANSPGRQAAVSPGGAMAPTAPLRTTTSASTELVASTHSTWWWWQRRGCVRVRVRVRPCAQRVRHVVTGTAPALSTWPHRLPFRAHKSHLAVIEHGGAEKGRGRRRRRRRATSACNGLVWACVDMVVNAVCRGIGQVAFANNPVSGLMIMVALCWPLPLPYTVLGVVALLSATAVARLLRVAPAAVRNGLFGFNAVLVGQALATFVVVSSSTQWVLAIAAAVLLGAMSVVVAQALGTLFIPVHKVGAGAGRIALLHGWRRTLSPRE